MNLIEGYYYEITLKEYNYQPIRCISYSENSVMVKLLCDDKEETFTNKSIFKEMTIREKNIASLNFYKKENDPCLIIEFNDKYIVLVKVNVQDDLKQYNSQIWLGYLIVAQSQLDEKLVEIKKEYQEYKAKLCDNTQDINKEKEIKYLSKIRKKFNIFSTINELFENLEKNKISISTVEKDDIVKASCN